MAQTDLYTNVHNRIMHTIQKVGVIQMSINGEMINNMQYIYTMDGYSPLEKGRSGHAAT